MWEKSPLCVYMIEKPSLGITIWHHMASLVMPNGISRERFFLSHLYTHDIFLYKYDQETPQP